MAVICLPNYCKWFKLPQFAWIATGTEEEKSFMAEKYKSKANILHLSVQIIQEEETVFGFLKQMSFGFPSELNYWLSFLKTHKHCRSTLWDQKTFVLTNLSRDPRNRGDAVLPKDIDRHNEHQLHREDQDQGPGSGSGSKIRVKDQDQGSRIRIKD